MAHALVTGAAGFIGSALAEQLLAEGWSVRGVDCFTPYYDVARKQENLEPLHADDRFEFVDADLRVRDTSALVRDIDVVFHLAAQPGVRLSWAEAFAVYEEHNVLATQRLLEGAKAVGVERFVYASGSSIYGNVPSYPTSEDQLPKPHSPYGVTKLAGEHLCELYAANWDVPTIALRYFTVYGPRQRPDMAIHRLIDAAASGERFPLYGTGEQVRDFTYVTDVVRATIAAGQLPSAPGSVLNIAGGASRTMNEVIALVEETTKQPVRLERMPNQPGDVDRTGATIDRAREMLGWTPEVGLEEGIAQQAEWQVTRWRRTRD